MLDNNYERPNYGPWNALADILGAYLQKRSIDGAMKEAAQYDQQVQQMQDPGWEQKPVQPVQEGAQAAQDTWARMRNNGQLYDFDWLHKYQQPQPKYGMDAALASVPGPAGSYKAPDTPIQSPAVNTQEQDFRSQKQAHPEWFTGNVYTGAGAPHDVAQAAYDKAQQANAARPAIGGSLNDMRRQFQQNIASYQNPDKAALTAVQNQQKQQEYDNYAAQMKAHPEWFAGSTYVADKLNGDKAHDDKVRQDAILAEQQAQQKQAQAQPSVPHTNPYQFQTDMEQYGFTGKRNKPLTYDEYVNKLKSSKTQLISRLVHKYGIEAAGKAEKMIDESINSHISSYGDQLLSTAMQGINQSLFAQDKNGNVYRTDMSIPSNKLAFLQKVQAYDNAAQRMGKPTYNANVLASILSMDNVKNVNIDDGGRIHVMSVPANGGRFDDGRTLHEQVVIPKMESPNNLANRKTKMQMNRENNATKLQIGRERNATSLQVGRERNATTLQAGREKNATTLKAAQIRGSRGGSGGGSGSNHSYNKTVDGLLTSFDLAEQSVKNGKTFTDDDDHNVQELNDAVVNALKSGNLSDEEKAALIDRKNQFDDYYQQAYEQYQNS